MTGLLHRVSTRVTSVPLAVVVGAQRRSWDLRSRLAGERGQTSSEYLLIAGIAVLIILGVLGVFKTQLTAAANTILGKITGAVQ